MSDIGFDGRIGVLAAMLLFALALVWAVVAIAREADREKKGQPTEPTNDLLGAGIIAGVGMVSLLLARSSTPSIGDWVGGIGVFAAPIAALAVTSIARSHGPR